MIISRLVLNLTRDNRGKSLQVRILVRAMNLLKPGGRLVYSTCSFNPIENEAVVAAGLNTFPGEFRIVPQDSAEVLPALKRRAGLKTWKGASHEPLTKKLMWHESEEAFKSYTETLGEETTEKGRKGV